MIQVKKQLMDGKYIFRHVNVNKETIKSLLTQFVKGSTYSSGEVKGIFEDFGAAIASSLASNSKVVIDGFGTFSLTVGGAGSNADPSLLRKDKITPSIRFIPSDEMLEIIQKADIVVKTDGVDDEDSNTDEPSTNPTTPTTDEDERGV